MPRYQNPADVNFYQSEPVPNGKLFFFESGTSSPKTTYADVSESIENSHPVLLDSAGREPNIFYSGSAKVVLQNNLGEQVWERDPVGGEAVLGNFSEFNIEIIYSVNDIVQTSDGKFYISLSNANQGNEPSLNPESWTEIRFIKVWNSNEIYSLGEVVQTDDGNLWKSLTTSNASNDPALDDGTNWTASVDVAEIRTPIDTVIPQTDGGELTALRENEIRDGSTYQLPLANSINKNQTITISLPDEFSANNPLIQTQGGDLISYLGGTDTEILLDSGSITITLTSDNVSGWGF